MAHQMEPVRDVMRMNCLSVGEKKDEDSGRKKWHVIKMGTDGQYWKDSNVCSSYLQDNLWFLSLLSRLLDLSLISRRHSH